MVSAGDAGDELELDIEGVAHGGVFVARHGADAESRGRVVFVPDVIPGERVRVRVTQGGTKSFWRAEALEVLDASPHRRPHVWPQADIGVAPAHRPGGADFGHIELDHQRELKGRVIADAMQRMAGLDLPTIAVAAAGPDETPDGTGWRTRVSLHVDDAGRIGPYAARSHDIVEVPDLPLATPAVARAATRLASGKAGRIDLVQPADGRVRILSRPADARNRSVHGRHLAHLKPETIVERVGDREFRLDAGGFWQVHRLAATALTDAVRAGVAGAGGVDPDAAHLDLYGGVGLFAAAIAEAGGPRTRVTSVEADAAATEYAGDNLAEWVGARAETGRVDRWIGALAASASAAERSRLSAGVTLLDPPRAGAGREVVDAIASLAPASVVYVACDPVALARDLATFRGHGYGPVSLTALDLFPNSHHVETVAVLRRV
ncbi:class I SAM-dependent RNA methyltransferase [Microbacterium sp. ASV49]|uniref:Class I SAM-dependent RNA methyltransferase n=1 Tax=Microbacterium candidum TaxID=3041922 RepID=A0ABT7N0P8_9MICO|nr:TRAM domain-containing protein [Microbacterium sp. ASV49]MDL9980283.1 class I SAM-dependent RNA methyltransferase [Microbacterium sp. ASV49]